VPRPFNLIGIGMGGPTLIQWGTRSQKQQLLRGIATNEEIWCQLFSEPGAGSDVAGLSTRAVRDGDEWVVNGQKVWTTLAHLSRWGMLLARTNPDVPKHRGSRTSWSTCTRRASKCGRSCSSRATPSSTRCSSTTRASRRDARRPEGDGWHVAITTLMNERVALSGAGSLSGEVGGSGIDRLIARHQPWPTPACASGSPRPTSTTS
jgi:alkylation response protein AidB-like acyl-CoA dehydrogenase